MTNQPDLNKKKKTWLIHGDEAINLSDLNCTNTHTEACIIIFTLIYNIIYNCIP